MLITPLDRGHRRPARVLRRGLRSSSGCRSTRSIRRRRATGRRSRTQAVKGATSSPRTAATSATRATRGRRTCARRSTSSTRRSRSRATSTAATSRRTCSAPSAPGPDLSQESGWHPDDWQRAHFYDPRFVDPLSLMPPMKSLFSDTQIEDLITYVETRSGKSGLLRYAGQLYAKHVVLDEPGLPAAVTGFQGAHKPIVEGERRRAQPAEGQLEEAPNLAQIDRSYWLSGNPLPVTEQNLLRGKEVFLAALRRLPRRRRATARARARRSCRRRRPTSPTRTTLAAAATPGPGDFYYRILRGWPGTGDGELRRPALGRRHLARRAVRQDDPESHARRRTSSPSRRTTSSGSPRRSCSPGSRRARSSRTTRRSRRSRSRDPFMQEAMRVFPGLAPGDKLPVNDGKTPLSLEDAAAGHQGDLRRTCSTAPGPRRRHAATSCRRASQKDIPPTVPGQQ